MDETEFSGIYAIYLEDGRCYVGSTAQSFKKRWAEHRQRLNRGSHPNIHLRRAWEKYGEASFQFCVLEALDISDDSVRISRENHWISQLKPEFNMAPVAGSVLGIKRRDDTKKLLREINLKHWQETPRPTGYTRPEKVGKAISNGRKGIQFTQEHIANLSASLKGRVSPRKGVILSDETKQKISANRSGIARSEEASKKAAESNKGRKRTEEQKAKISQGLLGKNSKLTEDKARAIKNSTAKTSELVKQYGVSRAQIYNIRSGRSWPHI